MREPIVVTDETRMPWGKYRGKKIEDVPAFYLNWLESDIKERQAKGGKVGPFRAGLLKYCQENRQALDNETKTR